MVVLYASRSVRDSVDSYCNISKLFQPGVQLITMSVAAGAQVVPRRMAFLSWRHSGAASKSGLEASPSFNLPSTSPGNLVGLR